jgi:hypothetical protein
MINKIKNTNFEGKKPEKKADINDKGYPLYPPSEDIYNQFTEEMDIDPENVLEPKSRNEDDVKPRNEEDLVSKDLDVPNSEADDDEEAVGNEDEENNYYSIGGDNHDNLEENN